MWGKDKTKEQRAKNSPLEETKEPIKKAPKKSFKIKTPKLSFGFLRGLMSIFNGKIFTSHLVISNIPFILFMVFLAIIYIANNYNVQSKVREIEQTTKELKDLRDEHISIKSSLMYFTKKSEVAKRLKHKDIKEATKPPFKIVSSKKEEK